jgi:nicotinate dehydrogenase subunit B
MKTTLKSPTEKNGSEAKSISRRQLLKGTGALVVSFSFWGPASRAFAQAAAQSAAPATAPGGAGDLDATQLDSWLAIAQDGKVTVFTSKVELGTGVETALAQMVAEELDVPFTGVYMDVGDTDRTVDQAVTAGSRTLERAGPQLRQAAAACRQQLLKLASARLGAPAENLVVKDGVVSVAGNPAKKISYGDLVGAKRFDLKITATGTGWDMKIAPDVPSKNYKDYKIVGTPVARVDLPAKFTGEYTYTQDVRVPGMLHGRVVRPPVVNSKPQSIDEASISNIPGVVKIVQEGNFVGVVAETEWAAIRAAKALKVNWSTPATKLPANTAEVDAYLKNTKSFRDQVAVNRGNVDAAMGQAAKTYEATFHWPFQLHGMIAPSCAVADVRGDKATIWAGSQGPFPTRNRVASLLGVPAKNVRVLYREGSGCYGRLSTDDVPEDAAIMSRAVGKPVRVQWMREDEHAWEPKGPQQLITVRAGVDAQGKLVAWDYVDRSFPWTTSGTPLLASQQLGIKSTGPGNSNGTGGGGDIYTFDHQKVVASLIPWVQPDPTPLRTSNLRAPGELARTFATESFIDEIASDLGVDPVQFRLRYLNGDVRPTDALRAAAKQAAWPMEGKGRPAPAPTVTGTKATGRGVAVANRANTITSAVAEVEVDKTTGKVTVKRVVLAHDCGLIVNPDGLKNQIEGNIIQGVSRTLMEQVQFDASGIKSLDWNSHPIITYADIPQIDIVLIPRPELGPLGGGEPSISPVPGAIANAIFDAVGVRLREVPFTPKRVLSALQGGTLSSKRV